MNLLSPLSQCFAKILNSVERLSKLLDPADRPSTLRLTYRNTDERSEVSTTALIKFPVL
jgi:hypothetical protein